MTIKRKPHMKGRKAQVSMTLDPDQVHRLDQIATARRCERSVLLRQAVDLFLAVNSSHTPIASASTTLGDTDDRAA